MLHVSQGWIASDDNRACFSEAVVVEFDPALIPLETLIEIHLHTHSDTSNHTMRSKYRSAIYTSTDEQVSLAKKAIEKLQVDFDRRIITEVIPFNGFKLNDEKYLNYYQKDAQKPFCKTFIGPKLKILLNRFSGKVNDGISNQLSQPIPI